ncbi:hypothetical protein [Bailinhaonella thermotolerans]|uniref:Uncharacterized protein n=1 Tax=Bailinhaonella thermotolerans TaxID=1070861 RepID=A0A3A4AAX8_9ACTN|nr:hypothetical protein [Bailinhaonella thermotolerans]RJL23987.1 hypothetical protein D5H75_31635 [Bailinhaonella thermotolerans]
MDAGPGPGHAFGSGSDRVVIDEADFGTVVQQAVDTLRREDCPQARRGTVVPWARRRTLSGMRTFGEPASLARQQRDRRAGHRQMLRAHLTAYAAAALLVSGVTLLVSKSPFWAATVAAAFMTACVVCLPPEEISGYRRWRRAARAVKAEERLRPALAAGGFPVVCHGAELAYYTGDCDIALATRSLGAAAVEIAPARRRVRPRAGARRGRVLRPGGDPAEHAAFQAGLLSKALTRELGRPARAAAVVCVPRMRHAAFTTEGGVHVCSDRQLPELLNTLPAQFTDAAEAERAFGRIWARHTARFRR